MIDDKRIQQTVEEYKNENGGSIKFTTKELIIGLYDKFDSMEKQVYYNKAYISIIGAFVIGLVVKILFL